MEQQRYRVRQNTRDGVATVILQDMDRQAEAELVPGIGANVFRYHVGENDILLSPPDLDALRQGSSLYGFPVLFPPSRVRNGTFSFRGREYRFPPNSGLHHLHGELRDAPWRLVETGADPVRGAYAVCEVSVLELGRMYAYYPHALRLRMTFTLLEGDFLQQGSIVNEGQDEAPFGIGFHPYFAYRPEEAENVSIQVPAISEYPIDAEGFFSGPLRKTQVCRQLSEGLPVAALPKDADHRVLKLEQGRRSFTVNRPDSGIRVICNFSREFGFVFLFEPPWGSAVSIEPVSSVTDAFQLPYPAEDTGVRALEAGGLFKFAVCIQVTELTGNDRGGWK